MNPGLRGSEPRRKTPTPPRGAAPVTLASPPRGRGPWELVFERLRSDRAAIVSAALLGFALSIDDFVITYFTAGGTQTFPVFVWGIARVAVPPQVNVVASAIFLVSIAIALGNVAWQHRNAKRQRSLT